MISIIEVAEMAGVSIATVSRYVNSPGRVREATAKRVAEAIKKTGYKTNTLARNFRTGKTQQIMVVLPSAGIPFYGPILEGVRKVADSVGYHILVMETSYNSAEFDDFSKLVMSKQTDGIILLSTLSPFTESNLDTRVVHPPIVLGLESISSEMAHFPCVTIDNTAAARDATQYLIGLGHKHIGFLFGNVGFKSDVPIPLSQSRAKGFRHAMEKNKLQVNEDWVIQAPLSIDGGRQAMRHLLGQIARLGKSSRPTALFCSNDEMALGAIFEINKAGLRVPEDFSIIGLDNTKYSEISIPALTTIEQPAYQIGEQCMRRLLRLIEGDRGGDSLEIIPHSLVERDSCRAHKS